jgi:hypothetical protein
VPPSTAMTAGYEALMAFVEPASAETLAQRLAAVECD